MSTTVASPGLARVTLPRAPSPELAARLERAGFSAEEPEDEFRPDLDWARGDFDPRTAHWTS